MKKAANKKNNKSVLPLIALLGIAAFCGFKVVNSEVAYAASEAVNSELVTNAISESTVKTPDNDIEEKIIKEAIVVENDVEVETVEEIPTIEYPEMDIDWDYLTGLNEDVVGWISVPALNSGEISLSYPVLQGDDNEFYLHHDINGNKSSCGSIFLNYKADEDMSDLNTFVYGHNMANDTMFGSLNWFHDNANLCNSDPFVYIYEDGKIFKYQIFAYGVISSKDGLYDMPVTNDAEYDAYVSYVQSVSEYDGDVDMSARPNVITMSTCFLVGGNYNFIVAAALVGTATI